MQNTKKILTSAAAMFLLLLGTVGVGKALAQTATSTPSQTKIIITISDNGYSNSVVSIPQGTMITWTNNGTTAHTVTSSNGSFSSGDIAPGASYSHTFNTVGTFHYADTRNSNINGTVNVTKTSSSSNSSSSSNQSSSQTSTNTGTIFGNSISQWIVLSGLFGGNVFGTTNGSNSNIFNNPISQWIVLSELFGGQNLLQ